MKFSMLTIVFLLLLNSCTAQENVDTRLYLGEGDNQPLIVAFGGGDGGNAWTNDRVKDKRDQLIHKGYAFLAVSYFGAENTPKVLDRISLNVIHDAIVKASENPKVDGKRIAVLGVSKGAELALLLASHFKDITCVIAMVPSHCAFPAHTLTASTSSWTLDGKEVPYVPMTMEAVPAAMEHDLLTAFTIMLKDKEAVEKALIPVENINGPVLLLSAMNDEQWPSAEMSHDIMQSLKQEQFSHTYQHIAISGGHFDVFDHFDSIYLFLDKNFAVD